MNRRTTTTLDKFTSKEDLVQAELDDDWLGVPVRPREVGAGCPTVTRRYSAIATTNGHEALEILSLCCTRPQRSQEQGVMHF